MSTSRPCSSSKALERDFLGVGAVGNLADAETQHRQAAVDETQRSHRRSQNLKGLGAYPAEDKPWHSSRRVVLQDGVEGVRKRTANGLLDGFLTEDGKIAAQVAGKDAQIV